MYLDEKQMKLDETFCKALCMQVGMMLNNRWDSRQQETEGKY